MSPRKKQRKIIPPHPLSQLFLLSGIGLIGIGLILFFLIFWPVISLEISYRLNLLKTDISMTTTKNNVTTLQPVDSLFGIIIPKIGANAKVIPNVDPYDSAIYQRALTKGVAHAKGSVFPGHVGNMFIFSHSSVNFYEAIRFILYFTY